MNQKLKDAILLKLQSCITDEVYPYVSKKLKFKEGTTLVVNMIYDQMKANDTWSFEEALSRVEYLLNKDYN